MWSYDRKQQSSWPKTIFNLIYIRDFPGISSWSLHSASLYFAWKICIEMFSIDLLDQQSRFVMVFFIRKGTIWNEVLTARKELQNRGKNNFARIHSSCKISIINTWTSAIIGVILISFSFAKILVTKSINVFAEIPQISRFLCILDSSSWQKNSHKTAKKKLHTYWRCCKKIKVKCKKKMMSLSTREGPACAQRRSLLALIAQKRQPTSNEKSQNERKKMRSMSGAALGMVAKKRSERVNEINQFVYLNEVAGLPLPVAAASFISRWLSLSLFRDFLACLRVAHSFAPFHSTLLPSFAAAMMMMNFSFRCAAASLFQLVA